MTEHTHKNKASQSGAQAGLAVNSTEATSPHSPQTPRRPQHRARQSEELYLPYDRSDMRPTNRAELPRQHSYHTTQEYGGGTGSGINVQQVTPSGMNYSNASPAGSLPGALQPGRPGAASTNTAPSGVPTLPQVSTHSQQLSTSRPSTSSHSHSYSRSSPAGLDQQKYSVPFINTPENSKYSTPPTQRYTSSQTPQATAAYSPLGLADIRTVSDDPLSANPLTSDGYPSYPTNSNYLAPWAVYAFDWCKWPVQASGEGAGKMAIGSYVEDGHNFVRPLGYCFNLRL